MGFIARLARVVLACLALAAAVFVAMVVAGTFFALDAATAPYAASGYWLTC